MPLRVWFGRVRLLFQLVVVAAVCAAPVACMSLAGSGGAQECHKNRGSPECR